MKETLERERPGVWFPAIRAGTGTDVFTERLVDGLRQCGLRADITWLPLRAEYAPWTVSVPEPPAWANLVHVNTWLHPRFIPSNLPVVATLHHAVHHPDAHAYKGVLRAAYHCWWFAPIERRVICRADKVTAVSQFVSDSAQKSLVDVFMRVIHNGVDTKTFRPGARQNQPGEPFKLLFVGSWRALKGVDLLAPILRELGENFVLRYTGGSPAETDKTNMPANMIDIGRLQGDAAVVSAMQNADALLFPSRNEGFGLVVVEAMACGLPVIATRGSSLLDLVEDGKTGLLCAQDDLRAFVGSIRSLAADSARYASFAQAARERALNLFTKEAMTQSYVDLYRALFTR
ncbi:glycosyltransferase family 4 protein [Luteimonas terricola]|nr:glycosyltransferase family 4 protein [Luteimonas terricola]